MLSVEALAGTSEAEVQLVENRLTVQLKRELYLTERTLEAKEKTFHSEVQGWLAANGRVAAELISADTRAAGTALSILTPYALSVSTNF